jgi:hypothetical protein
MKFQQRFNPSAALIGVGLAMALSGCGGGGSKAAIIPVVTPAPSPTAAPQTVVFAQIERLSRPAVKEVFERFVDHQFSNTTEPYDTVNDPLKGEIQAFEDTLRPPTATTDYGVALAGLLYPDEYLVNLTGSGAGLLGVEAGLSGQGFGGRDPDEDVITKELGVLFGNTLSVLKVQPDDGEENNCLSTQNLPTLNTTQQKTSTFPYFPAPH